MQQELLKLKNLYDILYDLYVTNILRMSYL